MYSDHFKKVFKPVVMTNQSYSRHARSLAETNGVILIEGEDLLSMDESNLSKLDYVKKYLPSFKGRTTFDFLSEQETMYLSIKKTIVPEKIEELTPEIIEEYLNDKTIESVMSKLLNLFKQELGAVIRS